MNHFEVHFKKQFKRHPFLPSLYFVIIMIQLTYLLWLTCKTHICTSVPLFCYTCVFPTISPLDCIRFPLKCPPGQLCLSSRAVGEKGEFNSSHWKSNLNESKLRKRSEKGQRRLGEECVSVICFFLSGDFRVVLYEKSCVLPSLCGITGEKYALGLNFTFTNECCNTHLCNGAATSAAPYWIGTLFTLLTLYSVWWIVNDIKQFGRDRVPISAL